MTVSVVVIGLNEGKHLESCFDSLGTRRVIYVDSASVDDSVKIARQKKVTVVKLDETAPMTASKGRNAGFKKVMEKYPDTQFVQFVDGDCVLEKGWLERGESVLEADPSLGAVFGHLREKEAQASVYHRLCQLEWKGPVGETTYFSGVVMIRASVFKEAGGYREDMGAGEEPELATRIRLMGYHIEKDDTPMAVHDADMTSFGQWWKRIVRSGMAVAESCAIHGQSPLKLGGREYGSILFWGGAMPVLFAVTAIFSKGAAVAVMLPYGYLIGKIYRYRRQEYKEAKSDALLWAAFCVWAKFPQLYGAVRYHVRAVAERGSRQ